MPQFHWQDTRLEGEEGISKNVEQLGNEDLDKTVT